MTGFESCIYCKHDGPPHDTTMARSSHRRRRCHGCPECRAEIAAEDEAAADPAACPRCHGTGKVPISLWAWLSTWRFYGPKEETCPRCRGSGLIREAV